MTAFSIPNPGVVSGMVWDFDWDFDGFSVLPWVFSTIIDLMPDFISVLVPMLDYSVVPEKVGIVPAKVLRQPLLYLPSLLFHPIKGGKIKLTKS